MNIKIESMKEVDLTQFLRKNEKKNIHIVRVINIIIIIEEEEEVIAPNQIIQEKKKIKQ